MARPVEGRMPCPECGSDAEVKWAKSGLLYRWCPECNAQYFPRTKEASDRLAARIAPAAPVTVTGPGVDAEKAAKPVTVTGPGEAAKKSGFSMGGL